MSISAVETKMPNAISVEVSGKALSVKLSDGRMIAIPVDRYPRLAYATKQERANWRIVGRGHGIASCLPSQARSITYAHR